MFNSSNDRRLNALEYKIVRLTKEINDLHRGRAGFATVDWIDRLMNRTESRLNILGDSISIIARTLDANNIKEACQHCGQVKESE